MKEVLRTLWRKFVIAYLDDLIRTDMQSEKIPLRKDEVGISEIHCHCGRKPGPTGAYIGHFGRQATKNTERTA